MKLRVHSAILPALALLLSGCVAIDLSPRSNAAQVSPPVAPAISHAPVPRQTGNASWDRGRDEALARIHRRVRTQPARNVILFVADGMSIPTITAARIYDGQQQGMLGAENRLRFETFPAAALVRTYSTDAQVADSAATATALLAGLKTRNGAIGMAENQFLDGCAPDATLPASLAELAEERGLSTGIVSTARITHATPASAYANVPARGWESDVQLPEAAVDAGCVDIAAQLLAFDAGDGFEVALGGGRAAFQPEGAGGQRQDGRDLTAEWRARGGAYVADAAGLRSLDAAHGTAPVLGLFAGSHLSFEADRSDADEPSLAEMTEFALERLQQNEAGYFLLVEAGRVDHAHHWTNAYRALNDMRAFNAAISRAADMVDMEDTLILVTADHSHVFSIAGYPARGNPILGLVRRADSWNPEREPSLVFARDGQPYTTLGYHNGPTQRDPDQPLDDATVLDPDFQQHTAVPMDAETHAGDDIAVFADGPRAHYFTGSLEQNTIFHLILAALGWPVDEAERE